MSDFFRDPDRACRDMPFVVFFPTSSSPDVFERAREVCGRCPVRQECLDWALENPQYGMWGGLTMDERAAIAREEGRSYCPRGGGDFSGPPLSQEALVRRRYPRNIESAAS